MRAIYKLLVHCRDEAVMMDALAELEGSALHQLHLHALGRDAGDPRDRIMICLMMEAGDRYLADQAAKTSAPT